jgi:hypothetical protein
VLDESVAVAVTQREQLLEAQTFGLGEETIKCAHCNETCAGPCAGIRRPRADLAEPFDGNGRSFEAAAEVAESGLGCRLHAVPCGQVVHPQSLVRPPPKRKRIVVAVEKIGRRRPHVGTGQEDVAVWLQRALVRSEHSGPVPAAEANAGLCARIRHTECGELPRHRSRQTCDFLYLDIGQHAGPARGNRKELMVDDDEGFEAGKAVAEFEDAHC